MEIRFAQRLDIWELVTMLRNLVTEQRKCDKNSRKSRLR